MKRIINIFTLFIVLLFIFFLISKNKVVLESTTFSISLWKDTLFPNLFPFFILSKILIEYDLIKPINKVLSIFFTKLFKLPKDYSYILLISLISGYPSGAKYINDLLDKKLISIDNANRLLTFTNYANPLFILGFISTLLNKKLAFLIFISHIVSGLITGIILNMNKPIEDNINIIKKKDYPKIGNILKDSIIDSINTLLLLLGIITIFLLISNFLKITFNLNNNLYLLISSILEMSNGIINTNLTNISLNLKTILITGIISFSGLSIHVQVLGILSNYKIKYKYFLLSRIIHSLIAVILVYILIRCI